MALQVGQVGPAGAGAGARRQPPAVLRLGFRPLYLLAGLFAALHLPLWLALWFGNLGATAPVAPPLWHAHEMLFGYAAAVIAGFLLTAVPNWTGRPTASGWPLGALALLWLAGRLAWLPGSPLPPGWAAALDLAFLPAVAAVLAVPLWRTRNSRNYGFPLILLLFALANLCVHLEALGLAGGTARAANRMALDLVVLVMIIVAGRVIPFFTANALPAARVRRDAALDRAAVWLALALPVLALPQGAAAAWVSLAAGVVNLLRMRGWGTRAALAEPLLWILHAAYLWIGVGLVLRGLAPHVTFLTEASAIHALTVGAVGSLTLGMMTRTALGHSGRPLRASSAIVAAYLMVLGAALLRVFGPLLAPAHYGGLLLASGALWSAAFATFVVSYWSILTRPRIDGRPG